MLFILSVSTIYEQTVMNVVTNDNGTSLNYTKYYLLWCFIVDEYKQEKSERKCKKWC